MEAPVEAPVAAVAAPSGLKRHRPASTAAEIPSDALLSSRRLSNKWKANSCWVDAALTLWETMQRWRLISHDQSSELREPPLQLPAVEPSDCTLKLGPGAKLIFASNLGQVLCEWWRLRVGEIAATERELDVAALTEQLMAARDAVRLAFLQRTLNSALHKELGEEMEKFGSAYRALEVFTRSAHASFLRAGSTPKCAALQCGKLLRSPSLTGLPTAITLSAAELTDAEGDCFAALQAKVNTPGKQGKRQKKRACPHCNLDSHFLEQPHTSVVADGAAPTLLVLDLPTAPPYPAAALPYDLRPSAEPRRLVIGGSVQGSYRLVGVLMYAKGYHFFADVIDPRERRWLRYDGRVAGGVGQPTMAGGVGQPTMHGKPGEPRRYYYPTLAVYVMDSQVYF